jgi:hypothetical protein
MKTLKLAIVALILACTFQAASAQVRVGVRLGTPPPRRHVVVVEQHGYRHNYRRSHYRRFHHERVVVRRHY